MTTSSRALSAEEHALLVSLIEGEWEGSEQARSQLRAATHEGWWFDGSLSFDIGIDAELPPIPRPDGILAPTERDVFDGDVCIGGVMIWLQAGRISSFEYYWTTDGAPRVLPAPCMITAR